MRVTDIWGVSDVMCRCDPVAVETFVCLTTKKKPSFGVQID